jgi:hypothetical protein
VSAATIAASRYPRRSWLAAVLIAGVILVALATGLARHPAQVNTIADAPLATIESASIAPHTLTIAAAPPAPVGCDPRMITGDMIYGGEGNAGSKPSDVFEACARLNQG